MRIELTILGTSSATPVADRFMTSQILHFENRSFLIDCGEGTQFQLMRYKIKINKISHILISHLHGDHYLGIFGLLSSMQLQGRQSPLTIIGPHGLHELIVQHFKQSQVFPSYPMTFIATDQNPSVIWEDEHIRIKTFPLAHRVPCTGFLFEEHSIKRKLLPENLPKNITYQQMEELKAGKNTWVDGVEYLYELYTLPPLTGIKYAFVTDTLYKEDIIAQIAHADWLYHEATYLHAMCERAKETGHSTAKQAASIAQKAEVKKLLIGHYSSRYKDLEPLLHEAKEVFPQTMLSKEGDIHVLKAK